MFSITSFTRSVIFCTSLLFISACTPALNWREVRLESADGGTLKAELPCKPDTATRKQQMGSFLVELSMMGCVANETTFTLSRIPLSNPLEAPKVLAAWQAAAAANVKAAPVPSMAATVAGAGAWPQAARVTLIGTTTQAQLRWFAKQSRDGITLYQAAMYGKPPSNEAATTFFESLQLQ